MRVTSCPDCGEALEIPEVAECLEEVTCPTCGLSGPADEWRCYAREDDESLLGRPLADATIPATIPRNWAIRLEQLEQIKDVMGELQHQVRLLRQALDELNDDLPDRVRRWVSSLQPQNSQTEPAAVPSPSEDLENLGLADGKEAAVKDVGERRESKSKTQSAFW